VSIATRDPLFDDGTLFGLPSLEECRVRRLEARKLAQQLAQRAKAWPSPRPRERHCSDAYLYAVGVAMSVARDLDSCRSLLLGEPVDRDRLRPEGLAWALQRRAVVLVRPVDVLMPDLEEQT
jgi:hypothetical protein